MGKVIAWVIIVIIIIWGIFALTNKDSSDVVPSEDTSAAVVEAIDENVATTEVAPTDTSATEESAMDTEVEKTE